MWRRSIHNDVGYFDIRYKAIGDQDFWIRVGYNHKLHHISEITGLQWADKNSLSGDITTSNELFEIQLKHQLVYEKLHNMKLPSIAYENRYLLFKGAVVTLAESGQFQESVRLFDKYCYLFEDEKDYNEFIGLVNKIKKVATNN